MNLVSQSNLNINSEMAGRTLARQVKKEPPAQRAVQAARIARGEVSVATLTTAQIGLLTHLSPASVALAKTASPDDLAALMLGEMSLRQLRAKRRKAPSDSAIRAFLHRAGIEPVLNMIDQLTAPASAVAAE
jgi:hypothetical protein